METSGANDSDQQITNNSRRKSRKERLPSLPAIKDESYTLQTLTTNSESFDVPNKTQSISSTNGDATTVPVTLASVAKERGNTLEMDSGIYAEIPLASLNHLLNECQPENDCNVNTDTVHNGINSLGNQTYETVDNLLNPECLYIEVLP